MGAWYVKGKKQGKGVGAFNAINSHHLPFLTFLFNSFTFTFSNIFSFQHKMHYNKWNGGSLLVIWLMKMSATFPIICRLWLGFGVLQPSCLIFFEHSLTIFPIRRLWPYSDNNLTWQILWSFIPHVGTNLTLAYVIVQAISVYGNLFA